MIGRVRRWRELPEAERRARLGRRVERLLRRPTLLRHLAPAPDRDAAFRRALRVEPTALAERLEEPDSKRGPWLGDLARRAERVHATHPGHGRDLREAAEAALAPRLVTLVPQPVDLRGPDRRILWHVDPSSRLAWSGETHGADVVTLRGDGADIRVLWEVGRFRHLLAAGQEYRLSRDAALRERLASGAAEQIASFLEHNPAGIGPHWACPMEAALRAVAWLLLIGLFRDAPGWDASFLGRVARSLWYHGLYLRRNPELHAGGLATNHLLADMLGLLAVARALPELNDASEWAEHARSSLAGEIHRQVLPDGVGFERSTAYHRLSAEIFLLAHALERSAGRPLPVEYDRQLAAMLEFTAACTRPDGTVPRWGDGDDGRVLALDPRDRLRPYDHRHLLGLGGTLLGRDDWLQLAGDRTLEAHWLTDPASDPASNPASDPAGANSEAEPVRGSRSFPEGGFHVLRSEGAQVTVACAPVGTAGLGNHSHNDTLALSLWLDGVERIVDPGTGCYGADPGLRNRLRSVAAHATIQVGDREPNLLSPGPEGLFGLRGKALPRAVAWEPSPAGGSFTGEHDGYSWPGARCIHRRTVAWDGASGTLAVSDVVEWETTGEAPRGAPVTDPVWSRIPLAPGAEVEIHLFADGAPPETIAALRDLPGAGPDAERGDRWTPAAEVRYADGLAVWFLLDLPEGSDLSVDDGLVSPRYGVVEPAPVLVARAPGSPRVTVRTLAYAPGRRTG